VTAQRIRRGRRAGLLGDVDALLLAAIRSPTLIGLSPMPPAPQTLAWRVPAPQAVRSSQAGTRRQGWASNSPLPSSRPVAQLQSNVHSRNAER